MAAHHDAGAGPVVQIGMDTPQVTAADLTAVADALARYDAVLGPAVDGGWWALARQDPDVVRHVAEVVMSTPATFVDTHRALERAGCRVGHAASMTDVDTVADADLVATLSPDIPLRPCVAQHPLAGPEMIDRAAGGGGMRTRRGVGAYGLAMLLYGAWLVLFRQDSGQWLEVGIWLGVGVLAHDVVLSALVWAISAIVVLLVAVAGLVRSRPHRNEE